MDCSLPGSSAHGIFQARVLEWGAIALAVLNSETCSFSNSYKATLSTYLELEEIITMLGVLLLNLLILFLQKLNLREIK